MLIRRWGGQLLWARLSCRHQNTNTALSSSISPTLLSRARALAAEHYQLSQKLLSQYDNQIAKKVGALSPVASQLSKWDDAKKSVTELQNILADPQSDSELRSLANEELAVTRDDLQNLTDGLQDALVPQHPFASLPCLIEIRPGAGGDEAALFTGDLLRMYTTYCKSQGMSCNVVKLETDMSAGSGSDPSVQEVIIEIDNEGAYGLFRCEAGVHRVQRVPATETKGRTHTSAAAVLVLPSFPDDGSQQGGNDATGEGSNKSSADTVQEALDDINSDYFIDPSDVRIETMRSRGAGGQHVNTTDSAVRLTHMPTNTQVSMQEQRSQMKNRQKAWQILRAKLAQARREARDEQKAKLRGDGVAKMGRGDKIRTYNFAQQRVTDHRCGYTINRLDDMMAGGSTLGTVMDEVKTWYKSRDLEELIQDEEAAAGSKQKAGDKKK